MLAASVHQKVISGEALVHGLTVPRPLHDATAGPCGKVRLLRVQVVPHRAQGKVVVLRRLQGVCKAEEEFDVQPRGPRAFRAI